MVGMERCYLSLINAVIAMLPQDIEPNPEECKWMGLWIGLARPT